MTGAVQATEEERTDSKAFFLVALAGCLAIGVLLLLTSLWSDRANSRAAEQEVRQVRAALAGEITTLASRLRAYAAVTPVHPGASGFSAIHGPFDHLFLADPSRTGVEPTAALYRGAMQALLDGKGSLSDARLRGALGVGADAADIGPARADVIGVDGRGYVAVGMKVASGGRGQSVDLVALETLDDPLLARLARIAGTRPMVLVAGPPPSDDSVGLSLSVAPHEPEMSLAWRPAQPGESHFRTIGSMLAGVCALFATYVILRSRRVTRALIDSEARARADAAQDLLTGLPNRVMFNRLLEAETGRIARGSSRGLAVLYIDIDRFKSINDTFGHKAGDRVICAVGERLQRTLRGGGRVARIAGDEFALIQADVESPRDCGRLAQRILDAFVEPIDLGDTKVQVTVTVGIALCPHDATTPDVLTHSADLALYRAKNEGRNRFSFFEQRMGEELRMRRIVEDELRAAIETDQLVMYYQPVMALDGQRMLGVEALVRWQHPVQGTIPPTSFITLAEECGLILPLGEWVLRTALRDSRRWPGLRVAVNVSAIQFRQKDFPQTVQRVLDETGVEAAQLELELTESVLLADADQAEDAMIELRAMGVRLALDDFGTGYSSLIYLRRFAFDKIKIDKSFLESMEATGESAIIVHSIVHLGRALGLTVTAEGIETREQHRFLQALGAHELQGFLFSQPVAASEIDKMVSGGERMKSVA